MKLYAAFPRLSVRPCPPNLLHLSSIAVGLSPCTLRTSGTAVLKVVDSASSLFPRSSVPQFFISCDATLLPPRLSLLLSHRSAAVICSYCYLSIVRLTETIVTMAVRTFTMPKSLNESLASEQPPNSDVDRPSVNGSAGNFSASEKEPLASDGPKRKLGITYAAQDTLPKLPIPELEDTCRKYQAVLAPLQNRREQEDTAAAVQDFLKSDGLELQARLKKYATGKTSYIEQFCTSSSLPLSFCHHRRNPSI